MANFIEMADAVAKAREKSTDAEYRSACDEIAQKLVWLAYRSGDLVERHAAAEQDAPAQSAPKESSPAEEPAAPAEPSFFDAADGDGSSSETEDDGLDFLFGKQEKTEPKEEEQKPFGPVIPEVPTPSFLKTVIEKEREPALAPEPEPEKEPSSDSLMDDAKEVNDPVASRYASDLASRMEMPEKEPKAEAEPAPAPVPEAPAEEDGIPEEKVKYLGTFQYDQMAMMVNSPDNTKHDEIIVTVYPLTAERNVTNAPIFVVLSSPYVEEPVFASSYEISKGNMIRTSIQGHEFMVYAETKDGVFSSQVMLTGKSMDRGESINIVQHRAHNPNPNTLGNGHIRFTYNAGAGVTGQIEVFPFGPGFVYIHKVENFCDMRQYGRKDVAIQTADGRMMQVAISRKDPKKGHPSERSIVSADLVPYRAG